ncbi:hypothetical protein AgCh_036173 [Apium graveolens]
MEWRRPASIMLDLIRGSAFVVIAFIQVKISAAVSKERSIIYLCIGESGGLNKLRRENGARLILETRALKAQLRM